MELLDARHLIALDIVARAIIVADVEWEEYPDIMESDFQIITAMVTQSGNDHRPDAGKVKEAYEFLSERCKETTEFEPFCIKAMTIMGHECSESADIFGGYLCTCGDTSWSDLPTYPLGGVCPEGYRAAKKLVSAGWRPTS